MSNHNGPVVITITNFKGGIGKTTAAVNIGYYFSQIKKKTLIVDLDSQSHISLSLGIPNSDGIHQVIVQHVPLEKALHEARPGLFVLPTDHTASLVRDYLVNITYREYVLGELLEQAHDFDLVIIDTPPSSDSIILILALAASHFILIPAQLDYLCLDGIRHILQTVKSLDEYPRIIPPKLLGILPTKFTRTDKETLRNLSDLQNQLGAEYLFPPIPSCVRVRESPAFGQTIWEYAPKSLSIIGYPISNKMTNSLGRFGGYLHVCEMINGLVFKEV